MVVMEIRVSRNSDPYLERFLRSIYRSQLFFLVEFRSHRTSPFVGLSDECADTNVRLGSIEIDTSGSHFRPNENVEGET